MKIHNHKVVITQDEDGIFIADVPSLPGCHTQAKNRKTLEKRIQEAIELYLNGLTIKEELEILESDANDKVYGPFSTAKKLMASLRPKRNF